MKYIRCSIAWMAAYRKNDRTRFVLFGNRLEVPPPVQFSDTIDFFTGER